MIFMPEKKENENMLNIIHVVPHIHWDREWYKPFYPSKIRLSKIVHRILGALENDKRDRFTFDGHTSWIDDFLALYPEEESRMKALVAQKKLFVGPWFVQADEFAVTGESIIRNLLIGTAMAKDMGYSVKVGYIPDEFGQMENMPQILKGFGIDYAIIHRGVGDEMAKDVFWWGSPDGSKVLTYCLRKGYTGEEVITTNVKDSVEKLTELLEEQKHRNSSGVFLLMDGADFTYPKEYLADVIEKMNIPGVRIELSDLERFMKVLKENLPNDTPNYEGEFRSPKYAPLLTGVYSSRIYIKSKNLYVSNFLERTVEPILSINYLSGNEYPEKLLRETWKTLLLCHPHDSISGCGSDSTHKDVEVRLRWVEERSGEFLREAVKDIFRSKIMYRKDIEANSVVIFNPNPFYFSGIAEVSFKVRKPLKDLTLVSRDGREIPARILSMEKIQDYVENEEIEFVDFFLIKAALDAEDIPPLGFKVFEIEDKSIWRESDVKTDIGYPGISNDNVEVYMREDNVIIIRDLKTNFIVETGIFKDDGDAGDEYTFSPSEDRETVIGPLIAEQTKIEDRRPFFARLNVSGYIILPESLSKEKRVRSVKRKKQYVEMSFTVYKNSEFVDMKISFENIIKDHRLRVLFKSRAIPDEIEAGEPFGMIKRRYKSLSVEDQEKQIQQGGYRESEVNFYPFQKLLIIDDGENGYAISTLDLTEYEYSVVGNYSILELTLVRAIGVLGRNILTVRDKYSLPAFSTPDAQCLKNMEADIRIIPDRRRENILKYSEAFLNPLYIREILNPSSNSPKEFSLLQWNEPGIILSSVKRAEKGDGVMIRFFSTLDEDTDISLKLNPIFKRASIATLAEKPLEDILIQGDRLKITIPEHKVMTLILGVLPKE